MKIVFFGTSDFAVSALRALHLSKHQILSVVTAKDRARGRGLSLTASAVKVFAQEKGLALLQPANLRDADFIRSLQKAQAELFVVAAYGQILTKEILQIPANYAINLHASLLPKYRGAAPINWAIIKGEKESGVTIFKMNEYMDKGEMILQKKTTILASDTAVSLTEKLAKIGAEAVVETVDLISGGRAKLIAQDEAQVSFAPKLKKEDGRIDWRSSALEIHNRIRGLQPWPGAFTYFEHKLLKIWTSEVIESKKDKFPGEITAVEKKGILVQTGKSKLLLTVVQLEGKKKMPANEFILGYKIRIGMKLGNVK
ncbi:MAG: methionyl-tRNA formyltransferase [Omnitrophica bacterium]|nr:methionyl-tRNA formyltransferase [Candidatus Omnitrophota bacterium]